jgi:hypothetical protein
MRSVFLFEASGEIASVLEIPERATDMQATEIVASALSLAYARGWDVSYISPSGTSDVMPRARVHALPPDHFWDISAGVAHA